MSHLRPDWSVRPEKTPAQRRRVRQRLAGARAGIALLVGVAVWMGYRHLHPPNLWAITVDGRAVAYVKNERTAEQVLKEVVQERAGELASVARFQQQVKYEEVAQAAGVVLSAVEARQEVARRVTAVAPAYWLIIEGKPFLATSSRVDLVEALRKVVAHYLPKEAELAQRPRFREKVDIRRELLPVERVKGNLVSTREATARLLAPAVAPTEYVVRPGDIASRIAVRYRISLADIVAANFGRDLDHLKPNDRIIVAGGDPPLTVILQVKLAMERDIPYWTEYVPDPELPRGQREVLNPGKPGRQVLNGTATYVNHKQTLQSYSAGKVIAGPTPERVAMNPDDIEKMTKQHGARRSSRSSRAQAERTTEVLPH